MIAIKNIRIYDFEHYIEHGYIVFDKTIIDVGDMDDFSGDYEQVIDGKHKLCMPGLINGHNHIYSTFARGMNVAFQPTSFRELLEQLWWKLDRNLTVEMTYHSALVSGIENIKHGVTTIIDHHASGDILGSLDALNRGLLEVGLRKVLCFETSDRFNVDECLEENAHYTAIHTPFTTGLVGLHASFTLSDETLQNVQKTFPTEPIHIHVAESIEDQEHSLTHYNKRVVERLDDYRLIRKDSILVHGLYLDDNELEIIRKNEAVVALNVTSNMNNGVGLPQYNLFKEKGIPVIIGNDGINQQISSEYQALYFAMHHQAQSPTAFTYDDLIDVIRNTYQYASRRLGVKLGKIAPDYEADLLFLDYTEPTPLTKENIFGHLLFGLFNDFKPTDVFVGGRYIVQNKQVSKSLQQAYQKAQQSAALLWQRIEKEGTQ